VSRIRGVLLAALLAGCGNLPTGDDGVAYLELIPPPALTLDIGSTLQFVARALDPAGEPVDVPIVWRTPDATITIDESGLVTGVSPGTGRVQAAIGDNPRLVSNFVTVTVRAPPEEPEPESLP
jgi:uncharacterized protein YjdB